MADAYDLMVSQCADLRADRDRLAALVEKLRPYAGHKPGCAALGQYANRPCDCGLADLLTEMENL